MLIADDAFYSVDNRANKLGFLYNQRTPTYATLTDRSATHTLSGGSGEEARDRT